MKIKNLKKSIWKLTINKNLVELLKNLGMECNSKVLINLLNFKVNKVIY